MKFPADDKRCVTFIEKEECLEAKSMFDSTASQCTWIEEESSCVYLKVELTVRVRLPSTRPLYHLWV